MTSAEQATLKPLIKAMIEAWVNNAPGDVAATLLADYESDAAINATYVGYANGSGAADGTGVTRCNFDATINQEATPQNSQHSYLRVDGPRCWVEMVVQNAVLYQSNGFVHYHSIYRDKLSDYGGEYGSSLNGASTATGYTGTTYTRPGFTTQPTSVSGSSATFTAAATANVAGSAVTPAYQWYSGTVGSGTAISGATSASYTTGTAGNYYVVATTAYGSTASNQVTLSVTTATAPTITTQPASQTVTAGNGVTFTVAATGNGALTYQWYFGGSAISGATSASYTISPVSASNAGSYYAVVTNTVGTSTASTQSSTATLTVNTPPSITTQPANQSVILGNSASFAVTASGSGTLTYQWCKGTVGSGTAISGATSSTYSITTTTTSSAGTYYCVVTNSYGTATSSGATLSLTEPLANFLSTYGLTSYTADSDGDGISNLAEFALGGNPTVDDTSILPTATRTVSNGTAYLVYSFTPWPTSAR